MLCGHPSGVYCFFFSTVVVSFVVCDWAAVVLPSALGVGGVSVCLVSVVCSVELLVVDGVLLGAGAGGAVCWQPVSIRPIIAEARAERYLHLNGFIVVDILLAPI